MLAAYHMLFCVVTSFSFLSMYFLISLVISFLIHWLRFCTFPHFCEFPKLISVIDLYYHLIKVRYYTLYDLNPLRFMEACFVAEHMSIQKNAPYIFENNLYSAMVEWSVPKMSVGSNYFTVFMSSLSLLIFCLVSYLLLRVNYWSLQLLLLNCLFFSFIYISFCLYILWLCGYIYIYL